MATWPLIGAKEVQMRAMVVPKHSRWEDANPNSVIVVLHRAGGLVRGWYVGPPSFDPVVPMCWHTSPKDNLLASVAIVRAVDIAALLRLELSIVDPDDLWEGLFQDTHHDGASKARFSPHRWRERRPS